MGRELRLLCELKAQAAKPGVWWLLGVPWMPNTVFSAIRCLHFRDGSLEPDYAAEADDINKVVPMGLQVTGVLVILENGSDIATKAGKVGSEMRKSLGMTNIKECEMVVATCVVGEDKIHYVLYLCGQAKLEAFDNVQQTVTHGKEIWEETVLLRCQMTLNIPLYVTPTGDSRSYKEQLKRGVETIIGDLTSSNLVLFAKSPVPSSFKKPINMLIWPNQPSSRDGKQSHSHATLASSQPDDLANILALHKNENFISTTSGAQVPLPVTFTLLRQRISSSGKISAPAVQCVQVSESTALHIVRFSIDVLCLASCYSSLRGSATSLVIPALCNQLKAMERSAAEKPFKPVKLCSYHFCPLSLFHPVTIIYDLNYGETEAKLVEARRLLHHRLALPSDRPMLRVANALKFNEVDPISSRSLEGSGVAGGQTSLVEGSYEYYHYLQDHLDDDGWGCAYRSLQTIISWFRLQQYTNVPVPSHREIQETLVSIGDKDPSFIGSREWIGAIELSFVLDKLLGVTCKILNVRSGAEMPDKCRELAMHFTTQGSPVMIGGGVLAYTLLGIDYNEFTGESSFLILDPHYTGGEDLKTIRAGGWCGWKRAISSTGQEFFLRNKFYNLLLPQRPSTV
ncbi:hypothetical protein O6H91_12G057300 [Diphasiastrum complanatum]|uniref:Uncharacterized protein n=1 Tax=Diphasiastrum complanatum TaxID=34168 RepID=A0ACC2C258_DIPCM|nr:hypothetical protein O6H91_12G057300 [Diphasiastrum complanatum]